MAFCKTDAPLRHETDVEVIRNREPKFGSQPGLSRRRFEEVSSSTHLRDTLEPVVDDYCQVIGRIAV